MSFAKYHIFLNKYLHRHELRARNKYAPDGIKYCNGLHQEYLSIEEFTSSRPICKQCVNMIFAAQNMVKDGQITPDQFKQNPNIIYGTEQELNTLKTCNVCKQEKQARCFEKNRRKCKECRYIATLERNSIIDNYIKDIERLQNDLPELEKCRNDSKRQISTS